MLTSAEGSLCRDSFHVCLDSCDLSNGFAIQILRSDVAPGAHELGYTSVSNSVVAERMPRLPNFRSHSSMLSQEACARSEGDHPMVNERFRSLAFCWHVVGVLVRIPKFIWKRPDQVFGP